MSAPIQPTLPFPEVAPDNPNVLSFVGLLRNNPCWVSSGEVLAAFNLPNTEHRRRWVRALAEAAASDVISGQLGYKHVTHASPDELHHAWAWLESQAKKMFERAAAIRRRAHQVVG